jgi:hypothetical protein
VMFTLQLGCHDRVVVMYTLQLGGHDR